MSNQSLTLIQRFLSHYVTFCAKRPWLTLFSLIGFTAVLSLGISRISLQTNISALLPEDTVSQRSNREAVERYAGASPYFLVVESSDPEMNRKVMSEALERVRLWPETIWAMKGRDPSFFLDRRLLFVDEKPLGEFADDVDAYVGFQKCEKMPGCVQLDDEPPEPSFAKLQEQLKSQPEVQSLSALFGEDALDKVVKEDGEAADSEQSGEFCTADGRICVVQAVLDTEPDDLEYSRKMVARGETLLKELLPQEHPEDADVAVVGIYRNLPLARTALMTDLKRTFGLGIGLMVLVIMFQFRTLRALLLLFVPLSVGSVWALGIFAHISPGLNLISTAGFIILAGLGIDFGLHLLTHYGAEREKGIDAVESVRETLLHLFPSLLVAGITTACGFFALTAAAFRGFAQLGLFATVGIFSTLVATFLVFPPLVLALQKLRPREGAFTRRWKMPHFLSVGFPRTASIVITVLGLALFVGSVSLVPQIALRYDFAPLLQKEEGPGVKFREALAGTSRGAVLILADDAKSLEKAAEGIRHRFPNGLTADEVKDGKEKVTEKSKGVPVVTLGTFLPQDQEKKLEHIALLADSADDAMRFGDEDWKKKLKAWLPLLKVKEVMTQENLPEWVTYSLRERDGTLGTVGLTYQDFTSERADEMLVLSKKLDVLRADNPKVRFAYASAVLGEVMPLLRQDGWRVTGLAILGLLIATLLIGRSPRRTILILSTILLAVGVTAASMVLFDWEVDFYNMLVFPVAFGIGVDGAIYVVWTVLGRTAKFDWTHLPVSARAVFGSTMTTFVVFLSLATSDNFGLSSLGKVGATALLVTLFANLIWLPAALSWLKCTLEAREKSVPSP